MTDTEILIITTVVGMLLLAAACIISIEIRRWRNRKRPDISEAAELADTLKRSVKA